MQLRRAGFEPRPLDRGEDAPPAAALLADLDDEGWRGRDDEAARAAAAAGCPLVLLSSFGREPGARRGSDLTVSAAAGLLHVTGTPADEAQRPAVLSPQQADALAGSFAALWVGAQALAGATSGVTELTKLECVAIATSWAAIQWLYAGVAPSRLGLSVYQPSDVFEARDGPVYTIIVRDEQWARLRQAMGDPEWARWEIFGSQQGRLDGVDVLRPRVAAWLAQYTREQILDLSLRHRLPFALANRPEQAAALQEQLDGERDHAQWLYRTTPAPEMGAPPTRDAIEARAARDPRRPLAGMLVIDVSTVWATPYVGQLLAQLGARVIKIESRRRLDDVRPIMTYFDPHAEGEADWDRSGGFREVNRGKESVVLDLTTAEGRALLHRLVAQADVLLSNLTPGGDRARRLGVAEDELWAINPGLVIGRLSAYQPGSQLEGMTGYGYGMLLMCGFGYAGPDRPWSDRSIAYPDPLCAAALALGLLRALEDRDRSGRGALIESTLFGVSAALMREFNDDRAPQAAYEGCLPCAHEEWIAVTCPDAASLDALAGVLGVALEGGDAGDTEAALASRSRVWEAQSLQVALRQRGVIAERVLDAREMVRSGELTSSGQLHIPEGETHLHFASPWVLDGERIDVRGRSPWLGEHTAAVFSELLAIDAEELRDLAERQIAW